MLTVVPLLPVAPAVANPSFGLVGVFTSLPSKYTMRRVFGELVATSVARSTPNNSELEVAPPTVVSLPAAVVVSDG